MPCSVRVLLEDLVHCRINGITKLLCHFVTGIEDSYTLPNHFVLFTINEINKHRYFGDPGRSLAD